MSHFSLEVEDLGRSVDFYREVFGMQIVFEREPKRSRAGADTVARYLTTPDEWSSAIFSAESASSSARTASVCSPSKGAGRIGT